MPVTEQLANLDVNSSSEDLTYLWTTLTWTHFQVHDLDDTWIRS